MANVEPTTEVNAGQSRILRNTSYLTGAFVLQKVISFLYYIVVVNALGVTQTGAYDPLKNLIPIALILIDFSLSQVVTREVARKPNSVKSLLSNVLGIKIVFALVVMLAFGFVTNVGHFSHDVQSSLYLVAIIVGLDTFTLSFFAVLRGLQNMKFEALGLILNQIVAVTVGYIAISMHSGLRGIFFATMLGSIFNFSWATFSLHRIAKVWPTLRWDAILLKRLLTMALPFAIAAMLTKLYAYSDRYLLLIIKGQDAVGFYAVANKLTFAWEFLPSAFAAGLYPAMSTYYIQSREKLASTFERSLVYLMLIAIPMSLGIFVLATRFIDMAFQTFFNPSATALRILILSLPVIFMNYPVGTLLNATNRTKYNTISMAVTVLVNLSINTFVVRHFSFLGAAFATFISGFVLFGMGLFWIRGVITIPWRRLISRAARTYGAAIVAAVAVFPFRNMLTIHLFHRQIEALVWVVVFAAIYIVALIIFRGIRRDELVALKSLLLRRKVA
jgi:O-antigen/teichoic acid export membrane protein